MRLLVTGGAGYVGSVVTEALLERGHEITVLDDLSTGHRSAVPPQVQWVHGSLRDPAAVARGLEGGTEAVLHFAARSLVAESQRDPLRYYDDNVGGAVALVRGMVAAKVRRLVFSSSAAVYGEPAVQPIVESTPAAPTHAYGGSKRAVEMLLEHAAATFGLQIACLRYFNAAGATSLHGEDHEPETHLIPSILRAVSAGAPVTVYGDDYPTPDGTCIRDYVHVRDLAVAHARALESEYAGILNLGSGRGHSVKEVVDAVRRVTGARLEIRIGPRRPGDPPRLVAAIEAAARELGWRPEHDLDTIVRSAWEWHRQSGTRERVE
jgi:UDP-glucose 4-epimerase